MKHHQFKRFISSLLVFAMVLALCPTIVLAGDTLPYTGESALAENEPTSHGYRAEDLLTWDPATDPDAALLRARVPLQNRIEAVAATQANPSLNPEVEYLTLAGDYGNAFFGGTSYTNEFSEYCFNFWQYIDYYAPWHGQTTENIPMELWDAAGERAGTNNWQGRKFEFGMMNLPNAAYTNAAHKNGVLSLGCIFLPRAYQSWKTLITQAEDGTYPYADKLIDIAEYYGFDGWFFNLEGSEHAYGEEKTQLQAMLKYMRDRGQYIQFYLPTGAIDGTYMTSGAADSVFKDYGWSTSGAISEVSQYGMAAVHGGVEAGRDRWRNTFSKFWSNNEVVCSIASLGTDFVHSGLDEDCGTYTEMRRENDDFQWMSAIRERMWFTGSSGNPTDATTSANTEVGVKSNSMPGIASLVTERSVVNGSTFYTNFNTGHGLVYAVDGEISNDHEWANLNLQDILPTWQFWFETEGTALKAEYDYGTKYKKALSGTWDKGVVVGDLTYGEFDFDLVNPYNGGSSLAVYGKVDADNFMHLYKTNLDVTANTKVNITFKKTSTDNVAMSLGVVLADSIDAENNTYTVTELSIGNTTAASEDWVTATVDLSAYAGKSIAMLGLYFKGEAEDYQMHIGQIEYLSGQSLTPAAPTGLTIDKAYDTGEMVVSWDMGEYDSVKQYNVYVNDVFVGGIYDETFYIKNVYATGEITVKLTAVGADGTESEAATASYNYNAAVTDLEVTTADGTITASWTPANAAVETVASVYVPATGETYTATAAAGETSVVVNVPSGKEADNREFWLKVTPNGGEAKAYDGQLFDSYCAPYDAPLTHHKLTAPIACKDWAEMKLVYTTSSGSSAEKIYVRGYKGSETDWAMFDTLPDDILTLEVTLTDYDGNVSEKTEYIFSDGEPVIPETFYRVFHLDAGRKYFSVENIKSILDSMADANFNQLELYFSDNQGFRFALNDMTVTTEFGTYDLTPALGDGYSDGSKYPDGTGKYLTQSDMDEIISYANGKGIELIPSLNVPGHMGAILEEFTDFRYTGSKSSIDLTSDEAVAFAKAMVEKYASYFASKGCKYFNFGADEFANDAGSSSMGFETIYKNGIYKENFVPFFNDVAQIIKDKGMTPRAFNDGVLYNNDTSVEMDTDVQVCYWSAGWNGYNLAKATTLDNAGFDLINTNEGFYWVLGNSSWQVSPTKAAQFDYTAFPGSTIYNPAGAMLCVWCDKGNADGDDGGAGVAEKIAPVIEAFGGTLPETRSTAPLIDESNFPDPVLRQIVMEQVGPYVTDLSGFTGTLDCSGKNVTDLTGLSYLIGLTGLNLTGTNVTKITSDMLPEGIKTLNLTNCTELTFVELEGHPDLVVDFTGCANVTDLYLSGTNMTEINISAMTKLHNFVISNSQISKITAASASAYTAAYYWNWQNAKLDLSADTKEGKLKDGLAAYFETAELPDEIGTTEVQLSVRWIDDEMSNTCNISLGKYARLSSLVFNSPYVQWYGALTNAIIEVSEDGVTYTQVAVLETSETNYKLVLPEGISARYVRVTSTEDKAAGIGDELFYTRIYVYGYEAAPKGFSYNGQKPALIRDELSDVIYERDGATYQLLDLLAECYKTFKTVRGTPVAELEGESWVDAAYLASAVSVPKGVKVVITGEEGNAYVPSNIPEPDLGALDEATNVGRQASIVTQSGQFSGEGSVNLFDGNKTTTKWCAGGSTGWVGFTLPESMVVGKWVTTHAGMAEQEGYITKAYRLQVLDPHGAVSEEEFLEMSLSEQRTVLRDASYWVDLDVVTDNSTNEVSRTIAEENLKQAQVYRLYVDQAEQNTGGAVRIYEMELYAYTGKLKTETNGVFIADEIGTWNVSYQKSGTELDNINVRVRLSDQDLVDLSEAVEAAKADAEAAQAAAEQAEKTAEEAKAAAEAAQARAEEAAKSAAEDKSNAEKAAQEAEAAKAAAEDAQRAAEEARKAAEAAGEKAEAAKNGAEAAQKAAEDAAAAAEESNKAAAQEAAKAAQEARSAAESANSAAESAALAAKYAQEVAEAYAEIVAMKAEMVEYLAQAQAAAEKAEEERKKAEEERKKAEEERKKAEEERKKAEEAALASAKYYNLIQLSQVDLSGMNGEQRAAAEEVLAEAREAISSAATIEEANAALDAALSALEEIQNRLCASDKFTDVAPKAWYHEGIDFMVNSGYMMGMSDTVFGISGSVTRGQLVTILYRVAGAPGVEGLENPFTDVEAGRFYTDAVIWAANNGIVSGVTEDTFAPNKAITREQIATILYRFDKAEPAAEDNLKQFPDGEKVSGYAKDAMNWAVSQGLISGIANGEETTLSATATATRAQIAVILFRYLEK